MKKKPFPPSFYSEEHLICSEYNSVGFSLHTIKAGEQHALTTSYRNYIFFLLEGNAEVSYGKKTTFSIGKQKFFILPRMTDLEYVAKTDLIFISHVFDKIVNFCDKIILQDIVRHTKND